ncbi:MAG: DNA-3-methyladenine glycosylase, partial [Nitrososphaerota archaeon]|nr:DNA-3-methyladenine glycosylase [Nitrososphaerota archaeon]
MTELGAEKILPVAFYERDPSRVANSLLGKKLVRIVNGHRVIGRITETEAYGG